MKKKESRVISVFLLWRKVLSPEERNRQLYSEARKDCIAAIRNSSENYDRNLITISSAFIAIPFALIRQVSGGKALMGATNFYFAAAFFLLTILLVVGSFQLGAKVNRCEIPRLRKYYIDGDNSALENTTGWSKSLAATNIASGLSFVTAILLTAIFVYRNLQRFQ
jgi:hypothetical protein